MRKFLTICAFFFLTTIVANEESYEFKGKHFIVSYSECDPEALTNVQNLITTMNEAVSKCGAQVLDSSHYVFPGNGMTMMFLLSESHASIHTYPEHAACFVDLFTCGDKCSHETFDAIIRAYLKPKTVSRKLLLRHLDMEEISCPAE